jgi:glycosyltransferase involved in cell wall biosynthesis
MTKVSIVTISFNQAKFVERTILSVLEQDYPNVEYIVVDPGSTDGSRDIIERYSSRISKIILDPDKGPADGLNNGFNAATGEVFGFLNADDVLLPGSLRRVAEFFDRQPKCDLVLGNGNVIDGEDNLLRHVSTRPFTAHRYFHDGVRFIQQSTFFRREAFNQLGGFNIENRTCWDGELFVGMVKQGATVEYVNEDLAAFRIHPASISGSGRVEAKYRKDCRRIFRDLEKRDWNLGDEFWRFIYRAEGALLKFRSLLFESSGRVNQ